LIYMTSQINLYFCPHDFKSQTDLTKYFVVVLVDSSSARLGDNTALITPDASPCHWNVYRQNQLVESGNGPFEQIMHGFRLKFETAQDLLPTFLTQTKSSTFLSYTSVVLNPRELLFLSSSTPTKKTFTTPLEEIATAYHNYQTNINPLNSHDAYFKKYSAENEIEHKLNLPITSNIWQLGCYFHEQVLSGAFPKFMPQFLDNFDKWEFNNFLYEVTSPEEFRGYISFIECPDNKYFLKQKLFSKDQLSRIEKRTYNVTIKSDFELYLANQFPNYKFSKLSPFRRKRYDANIESLDTGNLYSIMFDRCVLMDRPEIQLVQCEIEYLKTRSAQPTRKVLSELELVYKYVRGELAKLGIPAKPTFYSKLSFLKDAQKKL